MGYAKWTEKIVNSRHDANHHPGRRKEDKEGQHIHIHAKNYIKAESGSTNVFIEANSIGGEIDQLIQALKMAQQTPSE